MTRSEMPDAGSCQAGTLTRSSKHVAKPLDLAYRLHKHWQEYGFRRTAQKLWAYIGSILRNRQTNPAPAERTRRNIQDEVLALQPSELVEVKSEDEIRETLDASGKLRGLAFLPAMRPFCGKQFVVLKRVERIYLEESAKTRRMQNTVLLNEVMCDGLLMGCDRACFFYWREAWLRRARPAPEFAPPDPHPNDAG